jgi:hypothetical protein
MLECAMARMTIRDAVKSRRFSAMAKTFLRIAGRIAVVLAVAVVASCSTKIWDATHQPRPLSPRLLENLRPYTTEFTERLTGKFPVGTPEIEVMRTLWLDGFKPMTGPKADPRTAIFTTSNDSYSDFCRRDSTVHWSADEQGRLMAISGVYYVTCL